MRQSWTNLVSLLLAAALFFTACGGGEPYTPVTVNDAVAEIAEGLTLSVNPAGLAGDFGVRLSALDAQTFASGQAGSAWSKALSSLPTHLRLLSPVYSIKTNGAAPAQMFLAVIIPNGANTGALDLYAWDGARWAFLPATLRGNQLVASVSRAPLALALFEAAPTPPFALTTLEPGQTLTAAAASAVNGLLLGGINVQPDGTLAGQLPAAPTGQAFALYPLIRNYDANGTALPLAALLTDVARRANHMAQLTGFAASGSYTGLALDYRGVSPELKPQFSTFVSELGGQLRAAGKALMVIVPPPAQTASGPASEGYDWQALGAGADLVALSVSSDPAAFGNGAADAVLAWATGQINRAQLRLLTSALPVDGANNSFTLRDQSAALAPLGSVKLEPELTEPAYLGQTITATLTGSLSALEYDSAAFAVRYSYDDNGVTHTVWLTSADTLRQRFTLAEKYRLGGVLVTDLMAGGVPDALATAITQYKVNLASTASAPQTALLWTVNGPSGVVAQATAQPGQPYAFSSQNPGDYTIAAGLQAGSTFQLGSAPLAVANITPTPQPVYVAPAGGTTGGSTPTGGGGTSSFVPPPPAAAGNFELGGQVPGGIAHGPQMTQAGMKWVKFQSHGDAGGAIASGHAAGFKVLVSVLGDKSRVTDASYWPQYASMVAGMAAQGADAIEIWNEMNIEAEWPAGQISGATYVELLKQAYAAIKAANPSTLVISGALAPTGAEGAFPGRVVNDDNYLGQMAAAGAANYLDCVGVHFNSGTTSPNDTTGANLSGYHYSYYYWPMVDTYYNAFGGSRPLCFTELGYLTSEGYGPLSGIFTWASTNSLAEQAQWLAEAASLSANSGKVRLMIVWNVDFTVYGADPQAGFAMIRPDGTCPACASLDAVMP